jgi:hypothetical protein
VNGQWMCSLRIHHRVLRQQAVDMVSWKVRLAMSGESTVFDFAQNLNYSGHIDRDGASTNGP